MNTGNFRCAAFSCSALQNGLVGINSEVSYQLDHAPAGFADPGVAGVAQTEIR
jgi:hypothetical protein